MFGGSPLNRLSWLRTSHHFLNAIITLPETKWVLFNTGKPLVFSISGSEIRIAYLSTAEVRPLLGPEPFFGQAREIGEIIADDVASTKVMESARHHPESLPISFLGMYERRNNDGDDAGLSVLPTSEFSSPSSAVDAIKRLGGVPYFAMDVADLVSEGRYTEEGLLKTLQDSRNTASGCYCYWSEPRALMTGLDSSTAGIFACARSLADWNYRNKVCLCVYAVLFFNFQIQISLFRWY
jgi:NAD+ diphosphatase